MNDVEALFEQLVARFAEDPSVEFPSATGGGKFGASALKVDGKIFAMLAGEELVVKLPRQRVDELVGSGVGRAFDPGHGRVMKEWITVAPDRRRWDELADEARRFATANAKGVEDRLRGLAQTRETRAGGTRGLEDSGVVLGG